MRFQSTVRLVIALFSFGGCAYLHADTVTHLANVEDFENMEYQWDFTTTAPVLSFDSVVIEMSHDNVEQVQVFLENTGAGQPYSFTTLVNGFGYGTGNRIGVTDGDLTDLNGLAELTLVESDADFTVLNYPPDPVPTGTYLAEDWENTFGTGDPPYDPTTWRLVLRDNTFLNNEMGAIGRLTVNFTTTVSVGGDFNNDGAYDCTDVDQLVAVIVAGTNDPDFDLSGDGSVDQLDLDNWLAEAGAANLASGNSYLYGDATLDGTVDGLDFVRWNDFRFTSTAAWCNGDFNADGTVDASDFIIWNGNRFTSADAVVPEPTGAAIALLSALLIWNRTRLLN